MPVWVNSTKNKYTPLYDNNTWEEVPYAQGINVL